MAAERERRGIFITIEGPDGAGKSTQLTLVADRVRAVGRDVVVTREPGGTLIGERIREVVLGGSEHGGLTDALLFNAARAELVREVIRPALNRAAVVVCDRFADSTLAYQGYGAGVPLDHLRALGDIATGGLVPDRTILFDISPEAGLRRRAEGSQSELTRFESGGRHGVEFHRRVRAGFLALAAPEPARWRVIDADRSPEEVAADAWRAVADLFAS